MKSILYKNYLTFILVILAINANAYTNTNINTNEYTSSNSNVNLNSNTQLNPLVGSWIYSEVIYQNIRQPIFNKDLKIIWTFFDNGSERLYWSRDDSGFCERFASYKVKENSLLEEVWAINPNNMSECGRDPDMQVGKKTSTPILFFENEIWLIFNLGEETLTYILKPTDL